MLYVDKDDRMANSYSIISCWTWKWINKLLFHLFDLAILNSYILLSSYCRKKISQRFLMCPFEEYAGSGWKRMVAVETCRETTHHFCEHQQTGHQLQKAMAWSY
jgi:hypothetical protein